MRYDAFLGGSYESQSLLADCERTVNWYPEQLEAQGATAQRVLYPTPGVELIANTAPLAGAAWIPIATATPGRAHFAMAGREFAVMGTVLYEIDGGGRLLSRGTVAHDGQPATISSNGDGGGQLFITSGGNGYYYTLATNTLTAIAALRGKAHMGAFLDGYFLALDRGSSSLYLSALENGASWTPSVDFVQRSLAADPWLAMRVVGRYIMLAGEQTSEIWYNAGTAPFPLTPGGPGLIPYGIVAPASATAVGNELFWLGRAAGGRICVLRMSEATPNIISTYPLETALRDRVHIEAAVGDTYSDRGHTFYLLHLNGITLAYDLATGLWSERGTWINGEYTSWRPRHIVTAFGELRMLDADGGGVYRFNYSGTDIGSYPIRRMRRAPAIEQENRRIFYSSLELAFEPGLGLNTVPGTAPQAMLRFSNDGGKTWSAEQVRTSGAVGEYGARVRWNRLGSARRRVFEVSVTDDAPWRLMGAYMTLGQPVQGS